MSRSIWKSKLNYFNSFEDFKFHRSDVVLLSYIGSEARVHNGKYFVSVKLSKRMVGFKFGQLVLTKKRVVHKKKKKNLKKK